jgi:hypothetical protein
LVLPIERCYIEVTFLKKRKMPKMKTKSSAKKRFTDHWKQVKSRENTLLKATFLRKKQKSKREI